MLIAIHWQPTDKSIFYDLRVVHFGDVTPAQVEAYIDDLPEGHTGHAVDTGDPGWFRKLGLSTSSAVVLFNALALPGDPPPIASFKHGREEIERRVGTRIIGRASAEQAIIYHPYARMDGPRQVHDDEIVRTADYFIATAWRGYPKMYEKKCANSLDEARNLAVSLFDPIDPCPERPVMIYAVRGDRQVHVENVEPKKGKRIMAKSKNVEGGAETTAEPKAPRKTRSTELKLGEFVAIRPGSSLHKIVLEADKGTETIERIAASVGIRPDQVGHRLRHVLAVNHGIGHTKDAETGIISLVLPEGKSSVDDLVKAPVVKAEPAVEHAEERQPEGAAAE